MAVRPAQVAHTNDGPEAAISSLFGQHCVVKVPDLTVTRGKLGGVESWKSLTTAALRSNHRGILGWASYSGYVRR